MRKSVNKLLDWVFGTQVTVTTSVGIEFCRLRTSQSGRMFVKVWGEWYELLSDAKVGLKPYWSWKRL